MVEKIRPGYDVFLRVLFLAIAPDHPLARKIAAAEPRLQQAHIDDVHHMGTSQAALDTAEQGSTPASA